MVGSDFKLGEKEIYAVLSDEDDESRGVIMGLYLPEHGSIPAVSSSSREVIQHCVRQFRELGCHFRVMRFQTAVDVTAKFSEDRDFTSPS